MDRQRDTFTSWQDCYIKQRRFLISYAYRMTGSLADAEDIVQDTVADCLQHDFASINNPAGWMTRVCSHKALDLIKSAQKKRNQYIGTWLPDMIPDSLNLATAEEKHLEKGDSLSVPFLVLLQRLSPVERAVFLLKDVFSYPFKEIAVLLGKNEAACRKMAERARTAVKQDEKRIAKPPLGSEVLIQKFFTALQMGDQQQLEELLAPDSQFFSDGGGKVTAASMIFSGQSIATFFSRLRSSPVFSGPYKMETLWINQRPGLIISVLDSDGILQIDTIMTFELLNEKIVQIFAQRNPDKLRMISALNK
jgi:RNA polymerase sigma-70 factor (ECF subfamily)